MHADGVSNGPSVFELSIVRANCRELVAEKAQNGRDTLQAVDADEIVVCAVGYGVVPGRFVEVQVSACATAAEQKFDVGDFLLACPNVATLEVRIELKTVFLFVGNPIFEERKRAVDGIAAVSREPRNFFELRIFHSEALPFLSMVLLYHIR